MPLSKYQATKVLRITLIILKNWIGNERLILSARKHSRYYFTSRPIKYPLVKNPLYTLFKEARLYSRIITHRWFLYHVKSLYHELYLERYIHNSDSGR
jgi:hypothetical protein